MVNPKAAPKGYPAVTPARLTAITAAVDAYLATNAAKTDITEAEIIALAPEFAATPGTLKAVKDRLGLN